MGGVPALCAHCTLLLDCSPPDKPLEPPLPNTSIPGHPNKLSSAQLFPTFCYHKTPPFPHLCQFLYGPSSQGGGGGHFCEM